MADHCPATVGLDLCFEGSGGQVFENKFREQAAKDGVFLERRVEWVRMVAWTGMAVKLLLLGSRRAATQLLVAALSSVALLVLSHLPHSRLPQLRCVCARSPVAAAQGRAWWRAWLPAPPGPRPGCRRRWEQTAQLHRSLTLAVPVPRRCPLAAGCVTLPLWQSTCFSARWAAPTTAPSMLSPSMPAHMESSPWLP